MPWNLGIGPPNRGVKNETFDVNQRLLRKDRIFWGDPDICFWFLDGRCLGFNRRNVHRGVDGEG